MNRLQLVEIEDLPWCPRFLRDAATDYLRFIFTLTHQYQPVGRILKSLLRRHGRRQIIDLGSGSGGPWHTLAAQAYSAGRHVPRGLSRRGGADGGLTRDKKATGATEVAPVPFQLVGGRDPR